MKTIIGHVATNLDSSRGGKFKASFDNLAGGEDVDVIYTSPMYRVNGGGMIAIPEEGDIILAAHDANTGNLYYISTIVDKSLVGEISKVPNFEDIGDPLLYTEGGKPVKTQYCNQVGAGLDITRNYKPAPNKLVTSVNLKSEGGKKVGLDDSPGVEAVIVRNQHGDGILVKGDADDIFPSRCIHVTSNGKQDYTVMESSMDLRVVEGLDLTIENTSTGAMGTTPSEQYRPNKDNSNAGLPCRRWGGIYLRSEQGDVSISSKGDDGRIFIVTPKARIQINEDGEVDISSTASIQLSATGDINMEGSNVNIKARDGFIRLESVTDVSLLTGTGGSVNIDGGPNINLNASLSSQIANVIMANDLNDYYE